ncbi:MAG: RIP metalloprotease RseP [Candidatus Omnitrophica bacterium]|nr:RIP metalloprotease RseP [Candidatus Omnitrophota bacterium]
MMTVLAFLVVLSALIFVHELGHFLVARWCGVLVERFSIGFGKEFVGWTRGHTRYSICWIPFGGYVKMGGEEAGTGTGKPWEFSSKPVWARALIIFAGAGFNMLFAFLVFWYIFATGHPNLAAAVGHLVEEHPAAAAGVKVGDRVLAVGGVKIQTWDDMTKQIRNSSPAGVSLSLDREGERIEIVVVPMVKEIKDIFGKTRTVNMVGIGPAQEILMLKAGPFQAAGKAAWETLRITGYTYRGIWGVFTGGIPMKSLSGPVGIAVLSGRAAELGFAYFLVLLATISINLGVINLLPLPVFDGGHLMFLAVEALRRGRAVSEKVQLVAQQVMVFALIALMLVVTYNDFVGLILKSG